ncbi:hypothetical protein KBC86_02580 [Candidatus Gracilibacteria bacterium]|nr:hypothetical protein [Candidatus Gracilibacteria bacterium]
MNQKYVTLESISPKQKTIIGLGLIILSLLTGFLMYYFPSGLNVPPYIAIIALAIFFVAGMAIILQGKITENNYHKLMQGLILLMSVIPLWIAFDPMEKQCRANLYFIVGDLPCRIAFGIGAFLVILIFLLSFTREFQGKNNSQ